MGKEVLNAYATDPQAQELLKQLVVLSPNEQRFYLQQCLIKIKNKVWIANNSALQIKLLAALHSSPIGGHSGIKATYHRVKQWFQWRGLKKDVDNFVKQCSICQQAKHEQVKSPGLLQPLPIPQGAWQDWSMDFVEGLPMSEGCNAILVIVDRFTKYSHFIPLKHPFAAAGIARLVLDNVIKLHGVPKSIVSDQDRIFTSTFWKALVDAKRPHVLTH